MAEVAGATAGVVLHKILSLTNISPIVGAKLVRVISRKL
jgi:hypothetical protein